MLEISSQFSFRGFMRFRGMGTFWPSMPPVELVIVSPIRRERTGRLAGLGGSESTMSWMGEGGLRFGIKWYNLVKKNFYYKKYS